MPPGLELTTPEIIPQAPLQYRRMLHGAGNLLNALRRTAIGGASSSQKLLRHNFSFVSNRTQRRFQLLFRFPNPLRRLGKIFSFSSPSPVPPKKPPPKNPPS